MTVSDVVLSVCTVLGPILAVQAQRIVDRWRATRDRRIVIFRTLMATRATSVAPDHVAALNSIPIDFHGCRDVEDRWQEYFRHLDTRSPITETWVNSKFEKLDKLLKSISDELGFKFNMANLSSIYHPQLLQNIETEMHLIRIGLVRLLGGELSLPMKVTDFPSSQEAVKAQVEVQRALADVLAGKTSIKVTVESPAGDRAS